MSSKTWVFSHHNRTALPAYYLSHLSFIISALLPQPFTHKESVFPLNSSNDTLIVFPVRTDHDGGRQFLRRMQNYCGMAKTYLWNAVCIENNSLKLYMKYIKHFVLWINYLRFMHQSIPPAPSPPGYCGAFARLVSPWVGHMQILHCPGAGYLPIPGPFPSFRHTRGFLSEYNYTEGCTGRKADWLICQGQE